MKKIFTLLVAVSVITIAQAQSGPGRNNGYDQRNNQSNGRDVAINKKGFDKDSRYNTIISVDRQRDLAIARINREYDLKIEKVKDNFFKSRSWKNKQIRSLNNQRQQEIRMVYNKFSRDDRYDHSKRRY